MPYRLFNSECKKAAHHRGQGCKCTGCTNVPTAASSHIDMDDNNGTDDSDEHSHLEDEVDQLMVDILGLSDNEEEDITDY